MFFTEPKVSHVPQSTNCGTASRWEPVDHVAGIEKGQQVPGNQENVTWVILRC